MGPGYCNVKKENSTITVTGLTHDFMQDLSPFINCTFSYKLTEEGGFGLPGPDGKWSGMMGQLQKKEIDMTFPAMARHLHRDALGEPTSGVFYSSVVILAGRTSTTENNIAGYLLTFDVEVWIYLLCSMLLLSLIASLLKMASRRMMRMTTNFSEVWNHYFHMFLENMLCEASPETPQEAPVRVLSAVWWIAVVVLMNAFAGQMRACLLVRSEVEKISTVADLNARAEEGQLIPYSIGKSVIEGMLKRSTRKDFQKLWRIMRSHGSLLDGFLQFSDEMLTNVAEGRAAIVHGDGLLQVQATAFCRGKQVGEYYFAEEKLNTWMFVSYLSPSLPSALKQHIKDFVVSYDESGIRAFQTRHLSPPLEQCTGQASDGKLRFGDMISIFYLWGACCLVAACVFIAELLLGCHKWPW